MAVPPGAVAPPPPPPSTGQAYFVDTKKGEVSELKQVRSSVCLPIHCPAHVRQSVPLYRAAPAHAPSCPGPGQLLKNIASEKDAKRKRDVIKKVIAYMTLGIDVSR
jgi:hypothetical protein